MLAKHLLLHRITFWENDRLVNDEADKLATEALDKVAQDHPPYILEGTIASCTIGGEICTTGLKQIIFTHMFNRSLREYLDRKYGLEIATFSKINWRAHDRALSTFSHLQQITETKFIHSRLAGSKKRRHRGGAFDNPLCPLCHQVEDNNMHIYCCVLMEKLLGWGNRNVKHSTTVCATVYYRYWYLTVDYRDYGVTRMINSFSFVSSSSVVSSGFNTDVVLVIDVVLFLPNIL